MNIHVHIENLILDGLPLEAAHGPAVQAAVEAELTRLLGVGSLETSLRPGGARPSVPSEEIHLARHDTPAILGRQIGGAIYQSLRP